MAFLLSQLFHQVKHFHQVFIIFPSSVQLDLLGIMLSLLHTVPWDHLADLDQIIHTA